MSLSNIVSIAFDLRAQQLHAPDWMSDERFDITAKVPEGATRDQFHPMLQSMLVERFGLKFHHEPKEVQGYELVVARGGPKFKGSAPEPPKDAAPADGSRPGPDGFFRAAPGADGYPVLPLGVPGVWIMNNRGRAQWFRIGMASLAANLSTHVDKPVKDATGLDGKYDISLYWVIDPMRMTAPPPLGGDSMPATEVAGPSLLTAVQQQLGLKLEPKKVTIDVVVVDRAEKLPTEN
jgi:uncharacterized protein (TIGR03435 family)